MKWFRLGFAALIFLSAASVFAQKPTNENQTAIVEDFELNIAQERITETNFERATAAEINRENLSVKIGAGVKAGAINVLLRGITGSVRFRASLEQITTRLERLQQTVENGKSAP